MLNSKREQQNPRYGTKILNGGTKGVISLLMSMRCNTPIVLNTPSTAAKCRGVLGACQAYTPAVRKVQMLSQDTAQSANTPTSLAELKIATTLLWVKHLRLKHKPQTRRARRLTGTHNLP